MGFYVVLKQIKMFACIDDMVLTQDTINCIITSIGFHDCLEISIEFS